MLIELGVVEQRHKAVLEVLAGSSVVEVAERYGVSRQTLHRWLGRYARSGIGGLADASPRPARCPHRTPPAVEARIVSLRLAHPRWGPRTIAHYLAKEELEHYPSRSSIYRCLVRHHLIDPQKRRRRREDYRRWERTRAMELWQMDVMGGVQLGDGPSSSSSPASTTTRASASRPCWSSAPPRGRSARRFWQRCAATASPSRS